MNFFKAIWAWLTGLFSSAEHPGDTPVETQKAAETPAEYTSSAGKGIEDALFDLEQNAEAYENDQGIFLYAITGKLEDYRAAAAIADWPKIVKGYSDDTLNQVREWGTEFNFSPRTGLVIWEAVQAEYTRRNPVNTPTRNGMADDGGQR